MSLGFAYQPSSSASAFFIPSHLSVVSYCPVGPEQLLLVRCDDDDDNDDDDDDDDDDVDSDPK